MVLLRGYLEVHVVEAEGLPNLDKSKKHPEDMSDPQVIVKVFDGKKATKIGKSHTVQNCLNPKWHYSFRMDIDQDVREVIFDVVDIDRFKSDKMGSCSVGSSRFMSEGGFEGQLVLQDKKGNPSGKLTVKIQYTAK